MGRWKNIKSIESIQARTSPNRITYNGRRPVFFHSSSGSPMQLRPTTVKDQFGQANSLRPNGWKFALFVVRPTYLDINREWRMKIDGKTGLQKQRLLKDN